jgi:hypothetical protein
LDVQVNRSDLEAVWREAWIAAPTGATTFYEALTSAWQGKRTINAGGSLSNLAQNSSSHGYATPSTATRTTVDDERVCLEGIRFYEQLQDDLVVERDEAGELAIYNEGLARFRLGNSEVYSDFSLARLNSELVTA